MIRCTTTKCFIHRHIAGFPTKYEWYVWISGLLTRSMCLCDFACFWVFRFLQRWNLLTSKPRCYVVFVLDFKSGWAVQTASVLWMGRQIAMCGSRVGTCRWVGGVAFVAQAAQDFTQSKMMHPAVGKAKTETGRRVVWAQVSVGRYMLYTVHLCMCSCIMACWDCTVEVQLLYFCFLLWIRSTYYIY